MQPSPSRYRTALHNAVLPDGPLTPRQRQLADAVRHCSSAADFYAAPAEEVTTLTVARVPLGMADDVAAETVRRGIEAARRELARMEWSLSAYGPRAFAPRHEPVPAPAGGTRHEVLTRVLRFVSETGRLLVRVGDKRVKRDASRAYVLES